MYRSGTLRIGECQASVSPPTTKVVRGFLVDRCTVFRDRLAMETWQLGIAIKVSSMNLDRPQGSSSHTRRISPPDSPPLNPSLVPDSESSSSCGAWILACEQFARKEKKINAWKEIGNIALLKLMSRRNC